MVHLIRPGTEFDFVGKRKLWIGISVVALVASIILIFTKGLNYGIDFTGGAEVQVRVPAAWDIGKLRDEVTQGGIKDPRIVTIGQPEEHQFLIKVQGEEAELNQVSNRINTILTQSLKPGEFEIQRADVVGPAAGDSLRTSGLLSAIYALISILIYVTVRFDIRYSPGAVLALFHDAVITLGVFVITQKTFDLQVLAAILALIGYSNNDTIIVYDRVRETAQQHPNFTIEQAVNRSINDTLARTILTTLTTFISVASLWIFGGKVIHDFAFTLVIGLIVGSYSSIFVASNLVITLTHYQRKRTAKLNAQSGSRKSSVTVRPEPKFQP